MLLRVEGKWINLPAWDWPGCPAQTADCSFFFCSTFVEIWIKSWNVFFFLFSICKLVRGLYVKMSVYMFLYTSLAVNPKAVYQFSFIFPSITRPAPQLLPQLTKSQISKKQNKITTHPCTGPFSCFLHIVWGLSCRNQYLPCPVRV